MWLFSKEGGGKQAIWSLDDFVGSFHHKFLLLNGHVGLLISTSIMAFEYFSTCDYCIYILV
jgi:hypothetical protein